MAICAVSKVTDFTDHDDVGVLPQNGAQGLGKGQVDLGVHLRLPHTCQFVLDGVFHRHDVAGTGVKPLQRRIQAWWFCPSRWGR
jgi:hypothetical protein